MPPRQLEDEQEEIHHDHHVDDVQLRNTVLTKDQRKVQAEILRNDGQAPPPNIWLVFDE